VTDFAKAASLPVTQSWRDRFVFDTSELIAITHNFEESVTLDYRAEKSMRAGVAGGSDDSKGAVGPDFILSLTVGLRIASMVRVLQRLTTEPAQQSGQAGAASVLDLIPHQRR